MHILSSGLVIEGLGAPPPQHSRDGRRSPQHPLGLRVSMRCFCIKSRVFLCSGSLNWSPFALGKKTPQNRTWSGSVFPPFWLESPVHAGSILESYNMYDIVPSHDLSPSSATFGLHGIKLKIGRLKHKNMCRFVLRTHFATRFSPQWPGKCVFPSHVSSLLLRGWNTCRRRWSEVSLCLFALPSKVLTTRWCSDFCSHNFFPPTLLRLRSLALHNVLVLRWVSYRVELVSFGTLLQFFLFHSGVRSGSIQGCGGGVRRKQFRGPASCHSAHWIISDSKRWKWVRVAVDCALWASAKNTPTNGPPEWDSRNLAEVRFCSSAAKLAKKGPSNISGCLPILKSGCFIGRIGLPRCKRVRVLDPAPRQVQTQKHNYSAAELWSDCIS
jgi:hypothetical protein